MDRGAGKAPSAVDVFMLCRFLLLDCGYLSLHNYVLFDVAFLVCVQACFMYFYPAHIGKCSYVY